MNQNTFCSKCHRIPSQCCCSSVKELTDEEIMELWYPLDLHNEAWVEDSVLVDFARAILRKAQEK
jgi:hypothetical protein